MQELDKPTLKKGHGGRRSGSGRPAFVPTEAERKQVEAMSGYGLPQDHIAVLIRDGISVDTLTEHFANELKKGKAKANSQIGKTLFQKAMGGDTTAMIWWSKTQMKWSETLKTENRTEISGPDGEPVKVAIDDAISNIAMRIRSREL
jgi:hypothetical protein